MELMISIRVQGGLTVFCITILCGVDIILRQVVRQGMCFQRWEIGLLILFAVQRVCLMRVVVMILIVTMAGGFRGLIRFHQIQDTGLLTFPAIGLLMTIT